MSGMELHKLSERIFYSDYEEERDRPILGYVKGDSFSVAIDAGHSKEHLDSFYALLRENSLPLPELTVITHWHWDHSFAMHAANGLTVANVRTDGYLRDFISNRSSENDEIFKNQHSSIALEYAGDKPITVVPADIVFDDRLSIDAGDVTLELFRAPSPHTDDATLILIPEERVLFFGDALSGVFPTWLADRQKNKEFTKVIRDTDADCFIGGHWDPFRKKELLYELENYEPME